MARSGKIYKISSVIFMLLWGLSEMRQQTEPTRMIPCAVQAKASSLPPHLIQSVSEEDIYEGMIALGLAHCPVLKEPDQKTAFENVKDTVVRLDMGKAYGSGVIFRLTGDGAVIATNRHVLDYWKEESGVIRFSGGYYASARVLGSSENCDVGFLLVEKETLGLDAISRLRSVFTDESVYAGLQRGEALFVLGAGREAEETIFQEAVLEEPDKYIALFGGEMLYGRGFVREGMSGGGIFDGCGRMMGLLAGGTDQNEVAGVPVDQVMRAYREVMKD